MKGPEITIIKQAAYLATYSVYDGNQLYFRTSRVIISESPAEARKLARKYAEDWNATMNFNWLLVKIDNDPIEMILDKKSQGSLPGLISDLLLNSNSAKI